LNAKGSRISLVGVGEFSERGSAGEDIVGGEYRRSIECKVREGPDENASRQRVHSFLVSHMWHSDVAIRLCHRFRLSIVVITYMSLQDNYWKRKQEDHIFDIVISWIHLLANIPMFPTHQLLSFRIIPNAPPLIILPVLLPDLDFRISMLNHIKHTSLPLWFISFPDTLMRHPALPSGLVGTNDECLCACPTF
jgi:hypothetical protein